MKPRKYIDKSFPITLQDLIDLAKSEGKDPKDLKLIMNSNYNDLSAYVQCALLNQDCNSTSIELYYSPDDGFTEDRSLNKVPKSPLKQAEIHKAEKYLKEIKALVENMESDDLPPTSITYIITQGSKGYV